MFLRKLGMQRSGLGILALLTLPVFSQQTIPSLDRERAQAILQTIDRDIRKNYYDPKLHGVDWDAQVAESKRGIDHAKSFNYAMSEIAAAIDYLNDSHTFLLPPGHPYKLDFGWQYQMIGDHCFVTRVRPGSDVEGKGMKPGDEIITLNGYTVTRDTLWKMQYTFSVLRPQPELRLGLQDLAGNRRQVDVVAKIEQGKGLVDLTGWNTSGNDVFDMERSAEKEAHLMRVRYQDYGDQLLVLKLPRFMFSESEVGSMIGKARKHQNLIVDLRGNPGGSIHTLKWLVGGMFDKEVKIADRVGRKEMKAEIAKPMHNPFAGKLVVLVDASSASASELFARTMQIEKRGVVVGDHTSGSVMEAQRFNEKMGADQLIFYGAMITVADLIMADGKSLEHRGVAPDELLLPSAQDLANGRDPALARAAELLGVKISPDEAGKILPYEWPNL